MNKLIYRLIISIAFIAILLTVIIYARGYRLNFLHKSIVPTGILVASSNPDGGKIYINGELNGATNSNISLPPGVYNVEIKKDGFADWKKKLTIKGELVVKADALLIPTNPSLLPITSLGIDSAFASPTLDRIIIFAKNQNLETGGILLLETGRGPLSISNPLKLLISSNALPVNFSFKDPKVIFSPDGEEILVSSVNNKNEQSYLINLNTQKQAPFEVSQSKTTIQSAWTTQERQNTLKRLIAFKKPFPKFAQDNIEIIAFSPDETKILYTAKKKAELPIIITPRLLSTNQTEEKRAIEVGQTYVYDAEEDKNFKIDMTDTILWYHDSSHLIIKERDKISIADYDGTNKRVLYSGPFEKNFVASSRDSKVLILSNLNPQSNSLPDVYAVSIK